MNKEQESVALLVERLLFLAERKDLMELRAELLSVHKAKLKTNINSRRPEKPTEKVSVRTTEVGRL